MTDQDNSDSSVVSNPDFEDQGLPSVGELLNKERLRQGLTEKEVADDLHITMHYVRAIESNSFEKLPGNVFAKGYVKSYAMLLGMDMQPVLASYNAHIENELDVAKEKTRIQVRKRKDKNRPWVIASAALFVILFLGLWFVNFSSSEVEPEPIANVVPEVNSSPVSESAPVVVSSPVLANTPDADSESTEFSGADQASAVMDEAVEIVASAVEESSDDLVEVLSETETEIVETIAAHEADETTEIEAASVVEAAQPETVSITSSGQIIQVEAVGDDLLRISFSGESWVEISDDSQGQIYRDLLETGDVLEVKGTAPFNVLLGDAPFAELSLNGSDIDVSDNIRIDNSARLTVGLKQ